MSRPTDRAWATIWAQLPPANRAQLAERRFFLALP